MYMFVNWNTERSVACRMESDTATCHPTQVNTHRLNFNQAGWYSELEVSLTLLLNIHQNGLPVRRHSPILPIIL